MNAKTTNDTTHRAPAAIILIALTLASVTLGSCGNVLTDLVALEYIGAGTSTNPYKIHTAEELYAIRGGAEGYEEWGLDDHYRLMTDIDLSGYSNWTPLGDYASSTANIFTGTLDGNGHTISNLTISTSSNEQGLFGRMGSGGKISNHKLTGVGVTGGSNIGGLAGSSDGTIMDCSVAGSVSGTTVVGGFVGFNSGSTISNCNATSTVSGYSESDSVGGFTGWNHSTIFDCYSTGAVSGSSDIGGFVGYNQGTITDCYSTGSISGTSEVGGFIGHVHSGAITDCYYDSNTSGRNDTTGGSIPKTTAEMMRKSAFTTGTGASTDWDFDTVWGIDEGTSYPYLLWGK